MMSDTGRSLSSLVVRTFKESCSAPIDPGVVQEA